MTSPRVLVVEDDGPIRMLVTALLCENGYEVHTAANGQEALDDLEWAPDVILLDFMMPIMDGPTFRQLQRERADVRDIPVIVLTARRGIRTVVESMGASAVVAKPFDDDDLLDAIKTTLAGASAA